MTEAPVRNKRRNRRSGKWTVHVRDATLGFMYLGIAIPMLIFRLATGDLADLRSVGDWIYWIVSMFFILGLFGLPPNFLTMWLIDKGKPRVFISWMSGLASAACVFIINSIVVATNQDGVYATTMTERVAYLSAVFLSVTGGVYYGLRSRKPKRKAEVVESASKGQ